MSAEPPARQARVLLKMRQVLENLPRPAECLKLVVACSGGLDSSVLLWGLDRLSQPLQLELVVAHLNHGLRGAESFRDEQWVRARAEALGWPVEVKRLEGLKAQVGAGRSLQVVARQARQQFLEEIRRSRDGHYILLAHTQTDQAETLLLRLLRGTGTAGLVGMRPVQALRVRPLLDVSRTELEALVAELSIPYVEDSSNQRDDYLRNRVRHQVMPLLRAFNPSLDESLAGLAQSAHDDQQALELLEQRLGIAASESSALRTWRVSLELFGPRGLLSLPPALQLRQVRRQLERLWPAEDEAAQPGRMHHRLLLDQLAQRQQGLKGEWQQDWPGHLRVKLDRSALHLERLTLQPEVEGPWRQLLPCPGRIVLPSGLWLEARLEPVVALLPERDLRLSCVFDADQLALEGPLEVRPPQPGDVFFPFGRNHPMPLLDFLKKQALSAAERAGLSLVFCGSALIWIVGLRRGAQAPLSASTRRLVRLWVHQRDAA